MTPEEQARALVQDPELWKQHDEWVHHKCNWEQLPRYKMLEEYGSPPLEAKIATVLRARERAILGEVELCFNNHWVTIQQDTFDFVGWCRQRAEEAG